MPDIEAILNPDGTVEIHVLGGKGGSCLKLTAELEQALGIVESRVKLAEYFETNGTKTTEKPKVVI